MLMLFCGAIPALESGMKPARKVPAQLSQSVHHRLNMYALAASTAGVSLLAMAPTASAKIVYTPSHQFIGRKGRYKLDLNHDKIADFTLLNTYSCNTDFCVDILSAIPSGGNGVEGMKGFLSIPYASALKRGAVIGPKAPFSGKLMASSESSQGTIGRWLNVTNGYLGLKFTIKGKTHYGWARLTVKVLHGARIRATLTGYAYETIANKPIIAGKTTGNADDSSVGKSIPVANSPDSTLGRLALGTSAVRGR